VGGNWQISITDEIEGVTGTFAGWSMEMQGPGIVGDAAEPLPRDSTLVVSSSSTGAKISAASHVASLSSSLSMVILSMVSTIIVHFFF
jgi:subtilisin-like proprotein convertase family protein